MSPAALAAAVLLLGVSGVAEGANAEHDRFFASLAALCGSTFEGYSSFPADPADAFAGKLLVATIATCDETEIRVPFAVGDDRSRTWILSRDEEGLRLRHDHRHEDGSPAAVNLYGGWAGDDGSALSQSFAADAHTRRLIPEAATNVWTLSLSADGRELTYYLERHAKPRFRATLSRRPDPVRFEGLERLYFERVDDLARFAGGCAEAIGAHLPDRLDGAPPPEPPAEEAGLCDEYSTKDLPLPLSRGSPVLRQVIDLAHPRIHDQYWCLYTAGLRGDCWFFSPTPTRAEGKLLAALWLEDAEADGPDALRLRVRGTMVRPMGGWWTRGAELIFTGAADELRYRHALLPFTVIQPYDRAELTGGLDEHGDPETEYFVDPPMVAYEEIEAPTEASAAGDLRVVRRVVDAVTEAHLAACGVEDLRETSGSFEDWRRLAACLTGRGNAEVTVRRLDEPAFIERGGSPR